MNGNKIGKHLARQLRGKTEKEFIGGISTPTGELSHKEEDKLDLFPTFYKQLYTGDTLDPELQHSYLQAGDFPKVTHIGNDELTAQIDREEVLAAIKNLKLHKSPGPDGLTAVFFKSFASELLPYLTRLFNKMAEVGMTPTSMTEAAISVIPKPGKNLHHCSSYRPIALLNLDAKLYSTIIATRLNVLMPKLIHPDQSGFIRGRQTHDNIRRTIHLIEKANKRHISAVLVGLDAEKAFDCVDWAFLFSTLTAFGFSDKFITMIKANYWRPASRVVVNGSSSALFFHARGTRQGCPLSPLLFALSIEPLAMAIRNNANIHGLPFAGDDHKISLFADDVLLSLSEPATSLPALQFELERFERVAGFKINCSKSYILNLTLSPEETQRLRTSTPLAWADSSIQYLGVQLTPTVGQLYTANFPAVLTRVQAELACWKPLFLSWLGRVHAVKMTLLPKLLYLFQALPIILDTAFFRRLKSLILQFIWQGGRARFSFNLLRRPRQEGGVGLPDLWLYYKAAQLRILVEWSKRDSEKHWHNMDRAIAGREIWDLIWRPKKDRPPNVYVATPTNTTLRVWDSLTGDARWTTFPFPFTPIHFNTEFPPGLQDGPFKAWRDGGCLSLTHLFHNCDPLTFENCRRDYNLGPRETFHYTQLLHWATSPQVREKATRPLSPFESFLIKATDMKGTISALYKLLLTTTDSPRPRYMHLCETMLRREILPTEWKNLWNDVARFNSSSDLRDAHMKVMMDWYLHPVKLKQIFPTSSDRCWRGCGHLGDFTHIWWDCPTIRPYWEEILAQVKTILGYPIPDTMDSTLLGLRNPMLKYQTRADKRIMWLCLGAAKITLAAAWKKKEPPALSL